MFQLKALHFLGAASFASSLYVSYFYADTLKLTKSQIGIIGSLGPLISLFSIPAITYAAETYNHLNINRMLIICTILGSLTFVLHVFLDSNTPRLFESVIFVTIITAITQSSIGSLIDSITMMLLDESKGNYGKIRLYGSLSWGLSSTLTGYLIDYYDNQYIIFYLYLIFISIFLWIALYLPSNTNAVTPSNDESSQIDVEDQADILEAEFLQQDSDEQQPLIGNNQESLIESMVKAKVIVFFLVIGLIGMVFAIIGQFLFIYMNETWKAPSTVLGLTTPFSIFFELVIFYYSGYFLRRIGVFGMIIASHLLLIVRLSLYNLMPHFLIRYLDRGAAWILLPLELFHGASFAFYWGAGMEHIQHIAPKEFKSTYIGVYSAINNNLGGAIGTVIGGQIYQMYGYVQLWSFCIILTAASLVLVIYLKTISHATN